MSDLFETVTWLPGGVFLGAKLRVDMKIWGITRTGLDFALVMGSADFGGNVKFEREPRRHRGTWLVTLRHREPGPGSKVYNTRVGPAVCCHVHTEFMRAIFDINPEARIKTALGDYRNRDDLESAIVKWKMDEKGTYPSPYLNDHECECKDRE